ncbi:IclR family transcriptional regulator [Paraburkholderia sediminicola]|nr:IclR family transcriptional regulator [Paraburkholderia sediminicola]
MESERDVVRVGGAHGVQSAERVLAILEAFIGHESSFMLKTLAGRAGLHPAKVHRYLVSLCRAGFVEQDESTSRYRLGASALRLAFAAISSVDCVRISRPLMSDFCREVNNTVVLAIWNTGRPTIALRETLPALMSMTAREGYTLPILRSSIGNVFGAYLPREKTASLVMVELSDPSQTIARSTSEVDELFRETRLRGLARTTGQLSLGSHSFAAPVFDVSGEIAAVLCALGPSQQFDSNWTSPIAASLVSCAAELSRRLGFIQQVSEA